jgi:hypothetical protein
LPHFNVVGNALDDLERAVLAKDLAGLLGQAAIGHDLLLRDRDYETIDIGHGTLLRFSVG